MYHACTILLDLPGLLIKHILDEFLMPRFSRLQLELKLGFFAVFSPLRLLYQVYNFNACCLSYMSS